MTRFFHHPHPLPLRSGETLPGFTLSYEIQGTLNADGSNAILLFHALSGSQHAAGFNDDVPDTGGRWTDMVASGSSADEIAVEPVLGVARMARRCSQKTSMKGTRYFSAPFIAATTGVNQALTIRFHAEPARNHLPCSCFVLISMRTLGEQAQRLPPARGCGI